MKQKNVRAYFSTALARSNQRLTFPALRSERGKRKEGRKEGRKKGRREKVCKRESSSKVSRQFREGRRNEKKIAA